MLLDNTFKEGIVDAVKGLVGAQGISFANSIFESTQTLVDFKKRHKMITNIRNGSKIPIIQSGNIYDKMAGSLGNCSFNECTPDISYNLSTFVMGEYNCRIPICLESDNEDFLLFWGMYKQALENPLTQPDKKTFLLYVRGLVERYLNGALYRTAYHGDTSSDNTLINKNNGFWVSAEAGDGHKMEFEEASNFKEIYDQILTIYETASNKDWFAPNQLVWKMPYQLAKSIVMWINREHDLSLYNCACINPNALTASRSFDIEGLRILGIPVEAYKEDDDALIQGLGGFPENKIMLINKDNLLVGVNTLESLQKFRTIYDPVSNKVYIDLAIQIGTAIPKTSEYILAKYK